MHYYKAGLRLVLVHMPDQAKQKLSDVLLTWLQASAMDGIGHAGRARCGVTKVAWTIILLAGLVLTGYQIYQILSEVSQCSILLCTY